MICDRQLKRAYRHFNRKWFNDELPHDVDCFFSPAEDSYGQIQEEDNGEWTLQLNPKYLLDVRMWKMVLLHEMVHLYLATALKIKTWRGHGPAFQRAMLSLAKRGAFASLW